jgi:hypothetical protein
MAGPIEPQIGTNTHWGKWAEVVGVGDRECAFASTRLGRYGSNLVQTLIGTKDKSYGGRRSRVRIDARNALANVRAAPHIQHRRPNG